MIAIPIERFRDLRGRLDGVLARLAEASGSKLAAFNAAAEKAGAAPVLAPKTAGRRERHS